MLPARVPLPPHFLFCYPQRRHLDQVSLTREQPSPVFRINTRGGARMKRWRPVGVASNLSNSLGNEGMQAIPASPT